MNNWLPDVVFGGGVYNIAEVRRRKRALELGGYKQAIYPLSNGYTIIKYLEHYKRAFIYVGDVFICWAHFIYPYPSGYNNIYILPWRRYRFKPVDVVSNTPSAFIEFPTQRDKYFAYVASGNSTWCNDSKTIACVYAYGHIIYKGVIYEIPYPSSIERLYAAAVYEGGIALILTNNGLYKVRLVINDTFINAAGYTCRKGTMVISNHLDTNTVLRTEENQYPESVNTVLVSYAAFDPDLSYCIVVVTVIPDSSEEAIVVTIYKLDFSFSDSSAFSTKLTSIDTGTNVTQFVDEPLTYINRYQIISVGHFELVDGLICYCVHYFNADIDVHISQASAEALLESANSTMIDLALHNSNTEIDTYFAPGSCTSATYADAMEAVVAAENSILSLPRFKASFAGGPSGIPTPPPTAYGGFSSRNTTGTGTGLYTDQIELVRISIAGSSEDRTSVLSNSFVNTMSLSSSITQTPGDGYTTVENNAIKTIQHNGSSIGPRLFVHYVNYKTKSAIYKRVSYTRAVSISGHLTSHQYNYLGFLQHTDGGYGYLWIGYNPVHEIEHNITLQRTLTYDVYLEFFTAGTTTTLKHFSLPTVTDTTSVPFHTDIVNVWGVQDNREFTGEAIYPIYSPIKMARGVFDVNKNQYIQLDKDSVFLFNAPASDVDSDMFSMDELKPTLYFLHDVSPTETKIIMQIESMDVNYHTPFVLGSL